MDEENEASEPVENDTNSPTDPSVLEAKIAELTAALENANTALAAKDAELNAAKAANYDLVMSMPKDGITGNEDTEVDNNEVEADIDIDDLFESKD